MQDRETGRKMENRGNRLGENTEKEKDNDSGRKMEDESGSRKEMRKRYD